jgi:hypothetical protein
VSELHRNDGANPPEPDDGDTTTAQSKLPVSSEREFLSRKLWLALRTGNSRALQGFSHNLKDRLFTGAIRSKCSRDGITLIDND